MRPNEPEVIALLANHRLRTGPGSALIRYVREFEPYFLQDLRPEIYVVQGTHRALLRAGLLQDYSGLRSLHAGYEGAVVQIAARVIGEKSNNAPISRVVYLIDPRDPTSIFPENIALKRDCVVADEPKPFLATYEAAREWDTLHWYVTSGHSAAILHPLTEKFFLSNELISQLLPDHSDGLASATIALIAHDSKKHEMLKFAADHFAFLDAFSQRLATGTTGGLLNGKVPKRVEDDWAVLDADLAGYQQQGYIPRAVRKLDDDRTEVKKRLDELNTHLPHRRATNTAWVEAQPSGPRGGDTQIAERILQDQCQKVIFFEDPLVSRAHEADIQLLERAARIPELSVVCLHDATTADKWALAWEQCRHTKVNNPMTVVQAFRLLFNVELVLARRSFEEPRSESDTSAIWQDIIDAAAWYLVGLTAERAAEQLAIATNARVGITWGYAMYELIERVSFVQQKLRQLHEGHPKLRLLSIGDPATTPPNERFIRPENVEVLPLVGMMGATNPDVEANRNSHRLADLWGGEPRQLPHAAFVSDDTPGDAASTKQYWSGLDIAIFTCDEVREAFGTKAYAAMPQGLYQQMKHVAAGEIGGLFVSIDGDIIQLQDYVRVGIDAEQLRGVATRGGAILVAGAQSRRVDPVLSALRAGLVSVLVTNLSFAWDLLRAEAEHPGGKRAQLSGRSP